MHCPFCFAVDTKVIDSRLVGEGSSVRRRRQCLVCNERFTTFEVAELVMPRVVNAPVSRFHWLRPAASESLPVYMALA